MKETDELKTTVRKIEAERTRLTCSGCFGLLVIVVILAVIVVLI